MITKIRLKNWKSHLDSEFRFSKGVNAFIGQMGSGKSSVMDAISFALYGTFPMHQSRKVPLDGLIMNRPQKKKTSMVELFLSIGGKEYSIKRVLELERGTSSAEIRENGSLLEVNPQGVTEVVGRLLQMDYDLFSRAVYSEQNALDHFLTIPRGHRKTLIDRMLRLERFEKAREASVALMNRVSSQAGEKAGLVSDLEEEDPAGKRRELEGELRGLRKDSKALKARHRVLASERKTLEQRLSDLEERETLLNDSRMELEGMKTGLKEVGEAIAGVRERLKGRDIEAIRKETIEAKNLVEGILSGQEKWREKADSYRERIGALNKELSILREEMRGLGGLGAECPVCRSPVTEEKKRELLEERKKREASALEQVNLHAEELKSINKKRDSLDRRQRDSELKLERLSGLFDELKRLKELEERKSEYSGSMEKTKQAIKRLEMGFDRQMLKKLRREMEDKKAEEASISERLSGLEERVGDKTRGLEEAGKRLGALKRYRREIREAEGAGRALKRFNQALLLTQDQLRSEFLKTVNDIMGRIWGELYPYGDFEGIRLAIEGDYVLQLKEPGGWVSVEGGVSGGERSMACLALRIAFSLAFIPNLRWLILDEPTHNLDSEAIEHLAGVLKERMPQFVEQVFLITHEERISEGVTGSLYRLERDKDQNGPTMIAGG